MILFSNISAMRDLYGSMEQAGGAFPPIVMLSILHMCFPRFAEKGENGHLQQQVTHIVNLIRLFVYFCCIVIIVLHFTESPVPKLIAVQEQEASLHGSAKMRSSSALWQQLTRYLGSLAASQGTCSMRLRVLEIGDQSPSPLQPTGLS